MFSLFKTSGSTAPQPRSPAAPQPNSQGQHFVNPLGELAEPLLPKQDGSSSGSSPANSLSQLGEGLANRLSLVGQVAAPHLAAIQEAAQQQLKNAGHALEDITLSRPQQVGEGFKNATPSQIANNAFVGIGCLGRAESTSVLKGYIQKIANEHYGEPCIEGEHNIYACTVQVQSKPKFGMFEYHRIYRVKVQIAENSLPQIFYIRSTSVEKGSVIFSNYFSRQEAVVCQERNGRPGPIIYGIVKKDNLRIDSTQFGDFEMIKVNGQEHSVLRNGTLTLYIRSISNKSSARLFKEGTFTYSPDTSKEFLDCPEAYLALLEGTKQCIGHKYKGEPTQEERGTFAPVGDKGPGDREQLVSGTSHQVVLE